MSQPGVSGADAVRSAVSRAEDDSVDFDRTDALRSITEEDLEQILHASFDSGDGGPDALTHGVGASPGAAVGRVYFGPDEALDAFSRGEDVLLVKAETSPEDVHGMEISAGILTSKGGLVSHAAVVARGWGIPAVVGAEALVFGDGVVTIGETTVAEGDTLAIDGSTGAVMVGDVSVATEPPPPELDRLLAWADDIGRGHLDVRANADTGADAARARDFGAQGIGLCRTEHMFLGDRLSLVRRMILAADPTEEQAALADLEQVQFADFVEILEAMDGLPVTIRLLDPPLHEFLPDIEEVVRAEVAGNQDDDEQRLHRATRDWHEVNPMLGTRGVRLSVLKTGLYAMQVRAIAAAVVERRAQGGDPRPEIMIPLTVTGAELAHARDQVEAVLVETLTDQAVRDAVLVGTMIETPRAALRAADLAPHADFFSFGTNDLTQMTFGFSRDDVEGALMNTYCDLGLLDHNPFDRIDPDGVGELVELGVERGRQVSPDLKIGVCGEHGGDPSSIALFMRAGLDYVSCSPFRVPVARLAAAQAVLDRG